MPDPAERPCVNNYGDCGGPLAPPNVVVCRDCAVEYERLVTNGVFNDFVNEGPGIESIPLTLTVKLQKRPGE